MVNNPPHAPAGDSPERRIILSYAPGERRAALAALLALDDALAGVLRTTREPMVGQMRLTWWHDVIGKLETGPAPAEPVLQGLARHVVPVVAPAILVRMVEGWEELLDPEPLDDERLRRFAAGRGGGLFASGAMLLGGAAGDPAEAGGRAWALADLAAHVSDARAAEAARALAEAAYSEATVRRWSRPNRALGAMMHLSAMPGASPPARAGRALWHQLTGR